MAAHLFRLNLTNFKQSATFKHSGDALAIRDSKKSMFNNHSEDENVDQN